MNTKFWTSDLEKMSRVELYDLAKKLNIKGCAKFRKEELYAVVLPFAADAAKADTAQKTVKKTDSAKTAASPRTSGKKTEKTAAGSARTAKKTSENTTGKTRKKTADVGKKQVGRDNNAGNVKNAEAEAPAKKRGRPPLKSNKDTSSANESADITAVQASAVRRPGRPAKKQATAAAENTGPKKAVTGAEKRLDRGFGKKAEDAPATRITKGAEVVQPAVAIPVEMPVTTSPARQTKKAEQIEKERSRRHASLKTTMEIPVFSVPDPEKPTAVSEDELTGELPVEYGDTRIVLQLRDPHWAYVYWELPQLELKRLELEVGIFEFAHSHFVLRLHDVSHGFSQEIKLSENARNWYLYLENALTVYQVELGMQSPAEGYSFIALSNLVQTPPDRVSPRWAAPVRPDPEPDERLGGHEIIQPPQIANPEVRKLSDPDYVYFSSLTGEPLPHPGSSDILAGHDFARETMPSSHRDTLSPAPSSLASMPGSWPLADMPSSFAPSSAEMPSSSGISSLSVPVAAESQIVLSAAADIIIYGAVEKGCQLSFMGAPVLVRADGTYSIRLALPFDRDQQIELVATDPFSGQTRIIRASVGFNNR